MIRRSILISIPYPMSARNVLRSPVLSVLKRGHEVTILSPLGADRAFRAEFEAPDVAVRHQRIRRKVAAVLLRRALDTLESYVFTKKNRVETVRILGELLRLTRPQTYYRRLTIGVVFGWRPVINLLRSIEARFGRDVAIGRTFDEVKPDLVLLTHPLATEELPVIAEAHARGVPMVAMVHSWDNLSAKSGLRTVTSNRPGRVLPARFSRVIVWNEQQRQELQDFYGYTREEVLAAGVPQFDTYVNRTFRTWLEFCAAIGADPSKKLIVYAGGSAELLPRQDEIIAKLIAAIREERFVEPVQLLVRAHPGSERAWQHYAGLREVILQWPNVADTPKSSTAWQSAHDRTSDLAETLHHGAVIINVVSTIALDAAMLDRPIVCIAFDGDRPRPYLQSIRKMYDYTHYRPVVESGGVVLASSHAHLVEAVNVYLAQPDSHREGRRRIRETVCGFSGGRSAELIGEYLSMLANELRGAGGHAEAPTRVRRHA